MTDLLGNISASAPPIIFGGASISGEGGGYGFGDITENNAIELLHFALDSGIKIFDTAPIYGFGESERRLGKAFKSKREEVFLISKSGVTWHPNRRVDMSNDPVVTQKMLEQSLRDLDTDYIDLFMVHWPDSKVDIRRPMEILSKAKHQGKIKHIGLCNTWIGDIEKAIEVDQIEAIQNQLNVFENKNFEDVRDYLKNAHTSFMSWGTLDKGIVSGRVRSGRKYDRSDARSWAPWWKKSNYRDKISVMEEVLPILKAHGHTGLELALSYNLSMVEPIYPICGVRSIEQLTGVLDALKNPLAGEFLNDVIELIHSKMEQKAPKHG
ncbi:MAG: aldo/keto reductase [Bacteriovoracaceae bacterium]|nr:aldo/keto reductase [Bacteriovoracaceae bacterium]